MKSTFGTKLREMRELKGMTQEELAAEVKCVRETIVRYENDMVSTPNSIILGRLVEVFKDNGGSLLECLIKREDENEEE